MYLQQNDIIDAEMKALTIPLKSRHRIAPEGGYRDEKKNLRAIY